MEIKQPSLKELLAQRQTLQQQMTAARQHEAEVVLAGIVRKMREYQISLADLMGREHESPVGLAIHLEVEVDRLGIPIFRDLRNAHLLGSGTTRNRMPF